MTAQPRPLRLHVGRSLRAARYRLALIVLICGAAFGMVAGAYSAIDSLLRTAAEIQAEAAMADLELLTLPEDLKNLPDFAALAGVRQVAPRLLVQGSLRGAAGETVSALFVGAEPAQFLQFNRLQALAGTLPAAGDPGGVAVERNCATHHGLAVGDVLALRAGEASHALIVRGIVQSPEYVVAPLNPNLYVPADGSLCVLFGDAARMRAEYGFQAFNSVLLAVDGHRPADELRHEVAELAARRLAVDHVIARGEQFSQRFLELHLGVFRTFLPAIVGVFTAMSVLVVCFLLAQWIRGERATIGLMLTLGHGRGAILRAYLRPAAVLLAGAVLVGVPLAAFDLWIFAGNYADALGMPAPRLRLSPVPLAAAFFLCLATLAIGMAAPVRAILRASPLDAVREMPAAARRAAGPVLLRAVPGPFWLRYALRNLARNAPLTAVSVLAAGLSLGVAIAFYIAASSIDRTIVGAFERDRWEAVVGFAQPLWEDELEALRRTLPDGVWSPFVKGGAQLRAGGRLDNASLLGIDPEAGVRNVLILSGRPLAGGGGEGALVERRLAVDHGLAVGDRLRLMVRGVESELPVLGIHSGGVPGEILVPRQVGERLLGLDGRVSGAFLQAPAPDPAAIAKLRALPEVGEIHDKPGLIAAVLAISAHILVIIHWSAAISIAVTAIFLLACGDFAVADKRQDYGVLRLIGHADGTLRRIVVAEAVLQAVAAALLAVPLAWTIAALLTGRLTEVWFQVDTLPRAADFARILLPALLFMPLSALPALRSVLRRPPAEAARERRYG